MLSSTKVDSNVLGYYLVNTSLRNAIRVYIRIIPIAKEHNNPYLVAKNEDLLNYKKIAFLKISILFK